MVVLTAAAAATVVVNAVLGATVRGVSGRAESKLADREQRAAFTRAVQRAFTQFEKAHRDMAKSWFDYTFLEGAAAPLLREFFQRRGQLPDPGRLVAYWVNYRLRVEPAAVEVAAADFVRLLAMELAAEPVLRVLLDSAALDSIAASAQKDIRLQQIANLEALASAARGHARAARRAQAGEPDARDLAGEARDQYRGAIARMLAMCARDLGQIDRVREIRSTFQEKVLDLYDAFLDHSVALADLERNIDDYVGQLYDDLDRFVVR